MTGFEHERTFLTRLAYRMLGSIHDAEDVVQDAFVRWRSVDPETIDSPRAWLTTTTTRLCIDRLRRRDREIEAYHGEWLPEPWIEPDVDRNDTLSAALLIAIQRLSPKERATFLLHDVFDYPLDDVAAILEVEPANCRKIASRARKHLESGPRRHVDRELERRLGAAFLDALRDGDLAQLEQLLHEDVVFRSDGGGKVAAVHYPLEGRERVMKFIDRLLIKTGEARLAKVEFRELHAGSAVVVLGEGRVEEVWQFAVEGGRIGAIFVQRNPEKLRGIETRGTP